MSLILVFLLGTVTEVIQEFAVVSREGSTLDLAADMGGALLGLVFLNRPLNAMIME